MAAYVNKVILIGNLGRDPEVRYSSNSNGSAVTYVTVATSRRYRDGNGELKEETEWHRVVFFSRLAEIVGEHLRKGNPIYIEGRLRTRKWTGQDGSERYTTEIIGEQMQMLGKPEFTRRDEYQPPPATTTPRSQTFRPKQEFKEIPAYDVAMMDEDIPF